MQWRGSRFGNLAIVLVRQNRICLWIIRNKICVPILDELTRRESRMKTNKSTFYGLQVWFDISVCTFLFVFDISTLSLTQGLKTPPLQAGDLLLHNIEQTASSFHRLFCILLAFPFLRLPSSAILDTFWQASYKYVQTLVPERSLLKKIFALAPRSLQKTIQNVRQRRIPKSTGTSF